MDYGVAAENVTKYIKSCTMLENEEVTLVEVVLDMLFLKIQS